MEEINKLEEEIKFDTTDPLGRRVILKTSTWENHIKDRHPEKGPDKIKQSIENPRYIIKNNNGEEFQDSEREIFLDITITNKKLYYLKTVVEYKNDNDYGEVVTNYILKKYNVEIEDGGIIYDVSTQNKEAEDNI